MPPASGARGGRCRSTGDPGRLMPKDDPLSCLLSQRPSPRLGEIWGKLAVPTLIVQEGGYSLRACRSCARLPGGIRSTL